MILNNQKIIADLGISIGEINIYSSKNEKLLSFVAMQNISKKLKAGTYNLDLILNEHINRELGRYNEKFQKSGLNYVIAIKGTGKHIKVGNTHEAVGNDLLLGLSDNGLGRVNKSVSANAELLEFILKVGSKNIEFIVK